MFQSVDVLDVNMYQGKRKMQTIISDKRLPYPFACNNACLKTVPHLHADRSFAYSNNEPVNNSSTMTIETLKHDCALVFAIPPLSPFPQYFVTTRYGASNLVSVAPHHFKIFVMLKFRPTVCMD